MCVDRSSGFAGTAEIISLPIGRCAMPRTKPGGERFGMDSVGQAGERGAKRFLAHMPRLHTQQCATRGDTANFGHARQTKVGRLRDQGGKKGAFVGGRQTGRDMAEMLDEAGPSLNLRQHIRDTGGRHHAVAGERKLPPFILTGSSLGSFGNRSRSPAKSGGSRLSRSRATSRRALSSLAALVEPRADRRARKRASVRGWPGRQHTERAMDARSAPRYHRMPKHWKARCKSPSPNGCDRSRLRS
jgi:hypothetical protein